MRIIIFGASGSGTTTLAKTLAEKLNWTHLDADNYYWEKTTPPFQKKVAKQKRNKNLQEDFLKSNQVIVSGSLATWESYWNTAFDLGVFLRIPAPIRMERLLKREEALYGEQLLHNPEIIANSKAFLDWAAQYDDPLFTGRSITQHKKWIEKLSCKVIELTGDLTNEERMGIVINNILSIS
ncbi:AAA family ATPase [Tenacibaculum amylolyticum]|uniref:AAA family ATPase n=1 Tax=Tenacibaculum amylolyticum TaxID=104269 RepID=UPI003892DFCA